MLGRVTGVQRVAVVSDVHGNLGAYEAVLADLDARGITRVFNLGDHVGKGPRGREVVELSRERCEVNVLGNWDDFLPDPARTRDDEALAWWLAQLGPGQGEWLRGLPFCHDLLLSGRRVRLLHASARSVHRRVRYVHDEAEFLGQFANTEATRAAVGDVPPPDVVVFGDSHDPFYETQFGRTLVNAGSVGNCVYDPTPVYVVLEGVADAAGPAPFGISFVRVPYDVEVELAHARAVGMPTYDGWEAELRHGVYRGVATAWRAGTWSTGAYHHRR